MDDTTTAYDARQDYERLAAEQRVRDDQRTREDRERAELRKREDRERRDQRDREDRERAQSDVERERRAREDSDRREQREREDRERREARQREERDWREAVRAKEIERAKEREERQREERLNAAKSPKREDPAREKASSTTSDAESKVQQKATPLQRGNDPQSEAQPESRGDSYEHPAVAQWRQKSRAYYDSPRYEADLRSSLEVDRELDRFDRAVESANQRTARERGITVPTEPARHIPQEFGLQQSREERSAIVAATDKYVKDMAEINGDNERQLIDIRDRYQQAKIDGNLGEQQRAWADATVLAGMPGVEFVESARARTPAQIEADTIARVTAHLERSGQTVTPGPDGATSPQVLTEYKRITEDYRATDRYQATLDQNGYNRAASERLEAAIVEQRKNPDPPGYAERSLARREARYEAINLRDDREFVPLGAQRQVQAQTTASARVEDKYEATRAERHARMEAASRARPVTVVEPSRDIQRERQSRHEHERSM